MKEWIENVLKVQEVDLRIRKLNVRREAIPREKETLQKDLAAGQEKLKSEKEKTQQIELDIKKVESDIAKLRGEIDKLLTQSSMVKKNTEYQAMMHEIENFKKKISDRETDEIMLLDKIEEAKAEYREDEKQFAEQQKSVAAEIKELDELDSELDEEIKRLTAERPELEKQVQANVLTLYRRLFKSHGVPVVKIHEGTCGNCHLKLTPQTITEAKKGALAICDNCSRIVYLDDSSV